MNGIGGRTIAELKRNMTYSELRVWWAYRRKRGSLNMGRRVDEAVAHTTWAVLAAAGNKDISPSDFMLYEKDEDDSNEQRPMTPEEEAAAVLSQLRA